MEQGILLISKGFQQIRGVPDDMNLSTVWGEGDSTLSNDRSVHIDGKQALLFPVLALIVGNGIDRLRSYTILTT